MDFTNDCYCTYTIKGDALNDFNCMVKNRTTFEWEKSWQCVTVSLILNHTKFAVETSSCICG